MPLLDFDISVAFEGKPRALDRVRLQLQEREILGIAGESGSGKSTLALSILNLVHRRGGRVAGSVMLRGRDLLRMSDREIRRVRGREIALVLQNAMAALNPRLRLGTQFREVWKAHESLSGDWRGIGEDLLRRLGLTVDDRFFRRYPRELSIGMAQRVLLAMSILHRPSILIADEPTSALDLINQAELLNLFRTLNTEFGMSLIFISHDLVALASVCDRIAILREGKLMETVPAGELFIGASDPYTQRLVAALPKLPPTGVCYPVLEQRR